MSLGSGPIPNLLDVAKAQRQEARDLKAIAARIERATAVRVGSDHLVPTINPILAERYAAVVKAAFREEDSTNNRMMDALFLMSPWMSIEEATQIVDAFHAYRREGLEEERVASAAARAELSEQNRPKAWWQQAIIALGVLMLLPIVILTLIVDTLFLSKDDKKN